MDVGAVVVHVGIELHVSLVRHPLPREDLLDALSQIVPNLVEVVVLSSWSMASVSAGHNAVYRLRLFTLPSVMTNWAYFGLFS